MLTPRLARLRESIAVKATASRTPDEVALLTELERLSGIFDEAIKVSPRARNILLGEQALTKSFGGGGVCPVCGR